MDHRVCHVTPRVDVSEPALWLPPFTIDFLNSLAHHVARYPIRYRGDPARLHLPLHALRRPARPTLVTRSSRPNLACCESDMTSITQRGELRRMYES